MYSSVSFNSVSLQSKTIRDKIDKMMAHDFELLNHSQNIRKDILECKSLKQNHLIKEYISINDQEYRLINPLKGKKQKRLSFSKKKLHVSLVNSKIIHKPKQKLNLKMTDSLYVRQNNIRRTNQLIDQFDVEHRNNIPQNPSIRHLKHFKHSQIYNSPIRFIDESQFVKNVTDTKIMYGGQKQWKQKDILKKVSFSFQNAEKFNQEQLKNPQNNRIDELNPSRRKLNQIKFDKRLPMSKSIDNVQLLQSKKTKEPAHSAESYRYCIGCQVAVLECNIKYHELNCSAFEQVNKKGDKQLLQFFRNKIKLIQNRILQRNDMIRDNSVQKLKSRSFTFISQSKARQIGKHSSNKFNNEYFELMKIGRTWTEALEEINKLKWFIRISQKIEGLLVSTNLSSNN